MRKNHIIRSLLSVMLALALVMLCACSGKDKGSTVSVIKVGTGTITGNFNPFYAVEEGDCAVLDQVYSSIQRKGAGNNLINDLGSIAYEYESDEKVKYTVTVRNDLSFSNGSPVTIDDVIFWYYFLADASYDGVYKDFYLNDIEGIKEYYYDDVNYASVISNLNNNESQIKSYIKRNYADGIDVTSISGIKRVDDYTCTVLFNSRNINAVSKLNATIVSKAFCSADYVKGDAGKIKAMTKLAMGCGPYYLSDYNEKDKTAVLLANKYSLSAPSVFTKAEFTDITSYDDPAKVIKDGKVNIISGTATPGFVSALGSGVKCCFTNAPEYTSLFISASVPLEARKILLGLYSSDDIIDKEFGGYYTKLIRPLSVRFSEYPAGAEPYYQSTLRGAFLSGLVSELNAYCRGDENSLDYRLLSAFSQNLSQFNVKLNVKACKDAEFNSAVKSGKAQIWIDSVPDGDTCDKYEYYNTKGKYNYVGISDPDLDTLTQRLRRATGFTDRKTIASELLKCIMENAVEYPLYQIQIADAYDISVISPESLIDASEYDGYSDMLAFLY